MYTDAAGIDQRTISTANGQCRRKSTRLFCLYADVRMADLWTHETALRDGQQAFLAFFAIAGYGPGSAADATADSLPAFFGHMAKRAAKTAALPESSPRFLVVHLRRSSFRSTRSSQIRPAGSILPARL